MTSEYQYDFTDYITLLPSNLGGRSKSVYSGFRPSLTFKTERQYSGELFFDTAKFLEPGKSAIVTIKLLPAITIPKN